MNSEGYNKEIEEVIKLITPKIKKELLQTSLENREDLHQVLMEYVIRKLKSDTLANVPGFFEFIES
ncbi:hypothetical protein IHV09_22040 [Fictibacillus sp. 23RED33]|uniref:hypothetical protein n=1 Tax=Fictibacillus sp. 23RED33 TaxID=2745879 RepID=UPI0018CEB6F1|nr:hypothetical protein [Fictibacillus sp. 23RED33]MBH0176241.1 hypothetical protein [Fictibacillus sp. 23RED33]